MSLSIAAERLPGVRGLSLRILRRGETMMTFRATIQRNGKTATGIRVPNEIVSGLGSGKRPAVRVTINGYTYRSTVAPMGGVFMLPVSAEVRAHAGVAARSRGGAGGRSGGETALRRALV